MSATVLSLVPAIEGKTCSMCKTFKAEEEFYPRADRSGTRRAWCKPCTERQRRVYRRNYAKKHPEKHAAALRRSNLQKNYGITPEQFAEMLEKQHGRCAICRGMEPGGKGHFHVDHDHATDVIRGLLCHACNLGVGHFKDNPELLRRAIAYLEAAVIEA